MWKVNIVDNILWHLIYYLIDNSSNKLVKNIDSKSRIKSQCLNFLYTWPVRLKLRKQSLKSQFDSINFVKISKWQLINFLLVILRSFVFSFSWSNVFDIVLNCFREYSKRIETKKESANVLVLMTVWKINTEKKGVETTPILKLYLSF